jgi:hypothetical protein
MACSGTAFYMPKSFRIAAIDKNKIMINHFYCISFSQNLLYFKFIAQQACYSEYECTSQMAILSVKVDTASAGL